MEFQHNGKRHLVSWIHVVDRREVELESARNDPDGKPDETWVADHLSKLQGPTTKLLERLAALGIQEQERLGAPKKISRTVDGKKVYYDGHTICRIRTLKSDHESLPPQDRWETVAEGYGFKRSDEPTFDKKEARRISLARAIRGRFAHAVRTAIWNQFNLTWPPVSPESGQWERRYMRVRTELRMLEQQTVELMQQLKDARARHQKLMTSHGEEVSYDELPAELREAIEKK